MCCVNCIVFAFYKGNLTYLKIQIFNLKRLSALLATSDKAVSVEDLYNTNMT